MRAPYTKIATLFGTYSLGNAVHQALSIVLIPLYTALLTPEDFGVLALMTLAVSFLTAGISSPISIALDRFYFKPDYVSRRGQLLFNLQLLLVAKTLTMGLLYWLLCEPLCRALLSDDDFIPVARVYAGVLLMTPFFDFFSLLLRLKAYARYHVILSLGRLVLSVGTILYCLLSLELGIYSPIIGNIAGLLFYVLMAVPVLVREASPTLSLSVLKEPLGYAYPQIVTAYAGILMQSIDRYLLRVFGSLSTVGLYSLGCTVSSLIVVFLVEPLRNSLQPIVLRLEATPDEQRRLLRSGATFFYLLAIFSALGLSMFAKEAIMIIARNEEFWPAEMIVPIVSFTFVQHGLGYFAGWGLTMARKSYHISGVLVASVTVNLGLNLLLIPYWGSRGAALAVLLSYVVWNGLKVYYGARFYDVHLDLKRLAHVTAVGVGIYFVSRAVATSQHVIANSMVKICLLAGFWILLERSRFFTAEEIVYCRVALSKVKAIGLKATLRSIARGEFSPRADEPDSN